MRKLFYSLLGLFMVTSASYAQTEYTILEDLTNSKLVNADFSADAPAGVTIRTYDYDMLDDGIGAGGTEMYGQQAVTGWTAANPSTNTKVDSRTDGTNARAAGVFSYWDDGGDAPSFGLGGVSYTAPYLVAGGPTGQGLGMVAVWGATVQYTQKVTLPAGAYVINIPIINTSGSGGMSNMNGFIADDGTEYLSSTQSFEVSDGGTWSTDQIAFILDKETSGVISIGYKAGGIGSASAPHLFYDCVNIWKVDPAPIIAEQVAAAKEDLLKAIEDGEQVGADTKDAQAVYDDPNATLAQVEAAIEAQKANNESAVQDLSEFFIKNPHFTQDTPISTNAETGTVEGITTYDYDRSKNSVSYYGMQPVKNWTASNPADTTTPDTNSGLNNGRACGVVAIGSGAWIGGSQFSVPNKMSDGSDEGNVLGFVTCWSATTQYTQAVSIPAGKYSLTISYYNTGGTSAVAKNLMGFISDAGDEYLCSTTTFKVGSWEKMQVSFTLDEATSGKFSVGYTATNTGSGNMPHFFIDGIALNYVGDTKIDPSLFALQAAVSSATTLNDENSFNADLKEKFTEAIDAGQELVSSQSDDKEANAAATEAINNMFTDVTASIAAYKSLDEFRTGELEEAHNKYSEMEGMSDLVGKIEEVVDKIDTDGADYLMTTDEINVTIASLEPMIQEAIQVRWDAVVASGETLAEPLDITSLLEGLSYTYSSTAYSGSNVPDKEWAYGDATNFKTQYGTAEVWNQSPFEITRTLTDMPAGTYTITTRAFYRMADNDTNYDSYNAEANYAYVWAGHAKTPLTNVHELASDNAEAFANAATLTNTADPVLYVPNSQLAAHNIFEDAQYDDKTVKSVTTVLANPGELSFGIEADEMQSNSWVVWYSFQIAYNAVDVDVLAEEVAAQKDDAIDLEESVSNVQQAVTNLNNAVETAEAALSSLDKDALVAASEALSDATEYAVESMELASEANELNATYSSFLENATFSSTDSSFPDLLAQIDDDYESNAEIENIINSLPSAWVKYATSVEGIESASDDNPFDLTPAIINPSFETGDLTGWVKNDAATGDTGVKDNTNSTYAIDNCDGSYLFNTWNGSALDDPYYLHQALIGLPAGTYKLEALVSSSEGNVVTLAVGEYASDVTTTASTHGDDAAVVFPVEEGQAITITASSATWFKADNFRLTYYGKNSTAIDAVASSAAVKASTTYSVSGARTNGLKKGVNIVRYGNGDVKKVLVK